MRYQILYNTTVCGKPSVCACTIETKSGSYCYVLTEEHAKKRVEELKALGEDAWYEAFEHAWFDD